MPCSNYGISTTSLLGNDTDSENKLTDSQKLSQSPNLINKPSLITRGTNVRLKPKEPNEAMSDVIEGNEFIETIVDMRGIGKQKDIILRVYNDDQLIISDSLNTYNIEIILPSKVVSEPVDMIYKSGILTLKFEKLQK
jgi:hypothetical protein